MKLPTLRLLPVLAALCVIAVVLRAPETTKSAFNATVAFGSALAEASDSPEPPKENGAGDIDISSISACLVNEEKDVLLSLRDRQDQLDDRTKEVQSKRQELALASERLQEQKEQLEALRKDLENRMQARQDAVREDIKELTATFANMRPEKAGAVLARMRLLLAADIIERLTPRTRAPVLASMDPAAAHKIVYELDRRQRVLKGDAPVSGVSPAMQ